VIIGRPKKNIVFEQDCVPLTCSVPGSHPILVSRYRTPEYPLSSCPQTRRSASPGWQGSPTVNEFQIMHTTRT